MIKISILICTLPATYRPADKALKLFDKLTHQSQSKPVQVLYLGDNKSISVGEKRNKLIEIAEGNFVCFVDDDDDISGDYVDRLLEYSLLNQDVVTIGVLYTQDGRNAKKYNYDFKKNINFRRNGESIAGRVPNHLCLWKKSIAERVPFPDSNLGEDHRWAEMQQLQGYTVEHRNEDIIYYYEFSRSQTQTRMRR